MTNLLFPDPLILCCNQFTQENSIWQKLAETAVSGLFTLIGLAFAVYMAYRYALKQKRKETFIGLEQIKYKKKLRSLKGCWKLLVFTTDTETPKSILTWELAQNNEKTFYFNKTNAGEFLTSLADFFYGTGLGIYLSKDIKEKIFHYRNMVYGFLLKEKDNINVVIPVQNLELPKKMISLHHELILQLKKETEIIDKLEEQI